MEIDVISASLLDSNKVQTYSTHLQHKVGQQIVVNTENGQAVAVVKKANFKINQNDLISNIDKVERILTHHDKEIIKSHTEKAKQFVDAIISIWPIPIWWTK